MWPLYQTTFWASNLDGNQPRTSPWQRKTWTLQFFFIYPHSSKRGGVDDDDDDDDDDGDVVVASEDTDDDIDHDDVECMLTIDYDYVWLLSYTISINMTMMVTYDWWWLMMTDDGW